MKTESMPVFFGREPVVKNAFQVTRGDAAAIVGNGNRIGLFTPLIDLNTNLPVKIIPSSDRVTCIGQQVDENLKQFMTVDKHRGHLVVFAQNINAEFLKRRKIDANSILDSL